MKRDTYYLVQAFNKGVWCTYTEGWMYKLLTKQQAVECVNELRTKSGDAYRIVKVEKTENVILTWQ